MMGLMKRRGGSTTLVPKTRFWNLGVCDPAICDFTEYCQNICFIACRHTRSVRDLNKPSHVCFVLHLVCTSGYLAAFMLYAKKLKLLLIHVVLSITLIGHMVSIILPIQVTIELLVPCRVDVE